MLADLTEFRLARPGHRRGGIFGSARMLVLAGFFLATASGCSMYKSGFYNLLIAPCQFHIHKDQDRTEAYHRRIARDALNEMCAASPSLTQTKDYQCGFEDGVVQYLTYGGNELPTLAPPRKYWRLKYHNPEGHQAAQEWLAGCADGRQYAAQSGLRSQAVITTSTWGLAPSNPYFHETGTRAAVGTVPPEPAPSVDMPELGPATELLPTVPPEPEPPELPTDPNSADDSDRSDAKLSDR